MAERKKLLKTVVKITLTAVFLALTVVLSSFSIPVPGGHFYLNDTVICIAAILFDPVSAFIVGGVGAFLGDVFFYPTPMFVSLITHGIQAVVISVFSRYVLKNHKAAASGIGVSLGAVINVVGYTLGRAFVYATPEAALLKLPFQCVQAAGGAVIAMLVCYTMRFRKFYNTSIGKLE